MNKGNIQTTYFPRNKSGKLRIFILFLICGSIYTLIPANMGDRPDQVNPEVITFKLNDIGNYNILRASLMKNGESYKDGLVRQEQNIVFNRDNNEIIWTPCNDNSCAVPSNPTAGGTTGADQLILTVTLENPPLDVSSCYGDPTCEKLKGKTIVKSGMINGYYKTGKKYALSIGSLEPGFRETFQVEEIPI